MRSASAQITAAGVSRCDPSDSVRLRAQLSGLHQASRRAQDGISAVQTAECALNEVHAMLNRMHDLAVQAGSSKEKNAVANDVRQVDIEAMLREIDRVAKEARFGGLSLLDGSYSATIEVGGASGDRHSLRIGNTDATALGLCALDVTNHAGVALAITALESAISSVSRTRARLVALHTTFESVINDFQVTSENVLPSGSCIGDTGVAQKMVNATSSVVHLEPIRAMSSQANHVPQSILALLR